MPATFAILHAVTIALVATASVPFVSAPLINVSLPSAGFKLLIVRCLERHVRCYLNGLSACKQWAIVYVRWVVMTPSLTAGRHQQHAVHADLFVPSNGSCFPPRKPSCMGMYIHAFQATVFHDTFVVAWHNGEHDKDGSGGACWQQQRYPRPSADPNQKASQSHCQQE